MRKLTTKRLSVQLTIVILSGLFLVFAYSIVNTYNNHIELSQKGVLQKLRAVTQSLSVTLDGDLHDQLIRKYNKKDAIKASDQDSIYNVLHQIMQKVQTKNDIPTDMYLLFFTEQKENLCFSVTSGETPYYCHQYDSYPEEIKKYYDECGTIGPYTDDHGVWLSSFSPIKNSQGKTVAIIQADIEFTGFIDEARVELMNNLSIFVVFFLLITGFILYIVRRLSQLDEEKNQQLSDAFGELKIKNKDITDSINYALRIQSALIPHPEDIKKHLPKSFMFYEPKDVVSGDFPWFYKQDHYIYFAAVDCTGHGVPGAMMSIIGCLLLNDLANNEDALEPGELLNRLHKSVVSTLKQKPGKSVADGMDMAMCRIDLNNCEVHFAGAHRPLYHLKKEGELEQIKGSPYPIGGMQYRNKNNFKNKVVKIQDGDSIYFFSDGLPDQFGGSDQRKFGPKRIREIITETEDFSNLKSTIHHEYTEWKGDTKQIDDILLIGVKF